METRGTRGHGLRGTSAFEDRIDRGSSHIVELLLGLAPFAAFEILTRLSIDLAIWFAFAASFAICVRGFLASHRLRVLDAGGTALFGFLALLAGFFEPGLSVAAIRLVVDVAFFGIALASLVAREPFSLQYARRPVAAVADSSRPFVRANYAITLVWLFTFAVTALGDGISAFNPAVPITSAVAAGLIILCAALLLTGQISLRMQRAR